MIYKNHISLAVKYFQIVLFINFENAIGIVMVIVVSSVVFGYYSILGILSLLKREI
jgi:hypothetical protein